MQTKEIDIRDFLDARIEHFHDRSIRRLFENKENIRGLVEIEALDSVEGAQRREAIVYLLLLILHRRPVEEHRELVTLVDEYL